jgi:hypothetical protein
VCSALYIPYIEGVIGLVPWRPHPTPGRMLGTDPLLLAGYPVGDPHPTQTQQLQFLLHKHLLDGEVKSPLEEPIETHTHLSLPGRVSRRC